LTIIHFDGDGYLVHLVSSGAARSPQPPIILDNPAMAASGSHF
jgi:hypothetical protein